MQKNKKWMIRAVCLVAVALTLFSRAGVIAQAVAGSTYLVTTSASYKHPVTGKIGDSGSNEALGQSMSESVLYQKALLEKTADGKMYLTMRIFMLDNISSVKVWTQKKGSASWTKAATKVMQENVGGEYCADYRFAMAQTNTVVRLGLYVVPMGREVTFYFTFSNARKGSGDFKTTVQNTSVENSSAQSATAAPTAAPQSSAVNQSSASQSSSNQGSSSKATQSQTANNSNTGENLTDKSLASDEAGDLETEKAVSGADEDGSETEGNKEKSGKELLEQAQGLIVSDDSYLTTNASTEEVVAAEKTVSDSQVSQNENTEQTFRLSWVLVFQCILIITIPSLLILGVFLFYLELRKKKFHK